MRPLNLHLEGFKTFAEPQTFDFTEHPEDGLCFVTGHNHVDPELGANGVGKCLPPHTVLQHAVTGERDTIESWMFRVRDQGESLSVWGLDADLKLRPTEVTDVFYTGRKRILRVHLSDGSYQDVSETHPLLAAQGQVTAQQLSEGDYIQTPRHLGVTAPSVNYPLAGLLPIAALALAEPTLFSAGRVYRSTDAGLSALSQLKDFLAEALAAYRMELSFCDAGRTVTLEPLARPGTDAYQEAINELRAICQRVNCTDFESDGWLALENGEQFPGAAQLEALADRYDESDFYETLQWLHPLKYLRDELCRLRLLPEQLIKTGLPSAVLRLPVEQVTPFLQTLYSQKSQAGLALSFGEALSVDAAKLANDIRQLLLRCGVSTTVSLTQTRKPYYRVRPKGVAAFNTLCDLLEGVPSAKVVSYLEHREEAATTDTADAIPAQLANTLIDEAFTESGVRRYADGERNEPFPLETGSRITVRRLAEKTGSKVLSDLAEADVIWTKVTLIEELGEDATCDISVSNETHLYALDNVITHNSSVFDGMCVALYGKTSRGLKAGDIASWQIAADLQVKAEQAEAEGKKKLTKKAMTPSVTTALTFENYNGDTCIINRRWNPNVLTLQINDGAPKNVDQKELDAMIGYNFDEFLQAAYFSQFQDLFLDMGSTERSALVAKVLSLDVWDKYADTAKKEADAQKDNVEEGRRQIERVKGQIDELEQQDLSEQIAEWDAEWEKEKTEIKEALDAHATAETETRKAATDTAQAAKDQLETVNTLEDAVESAVKTALDPLDAAQADKLADLDQRITEQEDAREKAVQAATDAADAELAEKLGAIDQKITEQEDAREDAVAKASDKAEAALNATLAEIDQKITDVEDAREKAQDAAGGTDHQAEIRDLSKQEATLQSELDRLEKAMDGVEARAKKVEKLEGDCSACGQPITEEHVQHELDACDKELAELDDKAEATETDLNKVRRKLKKLERDEKAAADQQREAEQQFKQQLRELRNERDDAEDDGKAAVRKAVKDVEAGFKQALSDLRDERADFEQLGKKASRERVQEAEKQFKITLSDLRDERAELERTGREEREAAEQTIRDQRREEIKAAQETLYELDVKARTAEQAVADWERQLDELEADLEDIEQDVNPHRVQQEKNEKRLAQLNEEREKQFTELEQLVEAEEASRYWVRGFKSVKLFAVSAALNELEAEVNNALDGLGLGGWAVEFDVDKENKSGTLSKGFFAFISGPDNLEPVKWEAWSGGESQRLRLAASLGLANMIRASKGLELPFEIWDEPSQWMSDAGITGLLDVLQRRARRLKRQIWLIDHRGLEHPFDAAICVEKTHSGSTIKNVTDEFAGAV